MRYGRLIFGSLLIFFIVCHLPSGYAAMVETKMMKGEGPVDIEADQLIYEKETETYLAHGDVEVKRDDLSLKADHAQLNVATKDVAAWGNVVLTEGEDVVECERLEVNLETRAGKIHKARLFLKGQNFHITAQETEKLGENRYRVRDGSFTTCDAETPPWKFAVKELDITLTGQGIARGPVFYLEDIPLLYFPYAVFPVKKERQTGFLLPEVGYSSRFGIEFKEDFYWAISKDMDATFLLERRDRGFKEGVEYRYAFTKDTSGQASFFFTDDRVLDKNRYAFFIQHQEKLPYDFYLKGDINHVSDRFYTRDFDEDLPDRIKIDSRSLKELRSIVFGGKNWDRFSLIADGQVFQDLTKESNDDTVQKLPEISFFAHPQSFFKTPLFYDFSSSYVNFSREKGEESHRLDLFPRLSYPMRLFNVLKFESNVALRETAYDVYNDPTNNRLQGLNSRETVEANMQMSTEFFRIYDQTSFQALASLLRVSKWMHTIEPTISYSYIPRVSQVDLPIFDTVDRIPFANQITYGFTQRLIGKPEKEGETSGPFEYAKLRISQSYSFGDPFAKGSEAISSLSPAEIIGNGRQFSDIQTELWLRFNPYLTGRLEMDVNPYEGSFDQFNALVMARDKRDDVIQVQYRFTKDNISQVNLLTRVRTINPLHIFGGISYNLLEGTRVESIYGGEYQTQCWAVGLYIEDKNRSPDGTQKKELRFHVYFNLLGFGSAGQRSPLMRL